MAKRMFLPLLAACALLFAASRAQAVIVDENAPRVYFISPIENARVKSPFIVRFGLANWGVAPEGVVVPGNTRLGHHHLLINADPPPLGEPIIKDDYHRHYGGGETEALIHLVPGIYKLRLVFGDSNHYPIQGMVSEVLTITVVDDAE